LRGKGKDSEKNFTKCFMDGVFLKCIKNKEEELLRVLGEKSNWLWEVASHKNLTHSPQPINDKNNRELKTRRK